MGDDRILKLILLLKQNLLLRQVLLFQRQAHCRHVFSLLGLYDLVRDQRKTINSRWKLSVRNSAITRCFTSMKNGNTICVLNLGRRYYLPLACWIVIVHCFCFVSPSHDNVLVAFTQLSVQCTAKAFLSNRHVTQFVSAAREGERVRTPHPSLVRRHGQQDMYCTLLYCTI